MPGWARLEIAIAEVKNKKFLDQNTSAFYLFYYVVKESNIFLPQ